MIQELIGDSPLARELTSDDNLLAFRTRECSAALVTSDSRRDASSRGPGAQMNTGLPPTEVNYVADVSPPRERKDRVIAASKGAAPVRPTTAVEPRAAQRRVGSNGLLGGMLVQVEGSSNFDGVSRIGRFVTNPPPLRNP